MVEELYNTRIHFNLGRKIYTGLLFFPIPVRFDRVGLEQSSIFGKKGQYSYGEVGSNILSIITTTTTSSIIFAITPPKVGHFGNILCNKR